MYDIIESTPCAKQHITSLMHVTVMRPTVFGVFLTISSSRFVGIRSHFSFKDPPQYISQDKVWTLTLVYKVLHDRLSDYNVHRSVPPLCFTVVIRCLCRYAVFRFHQSQRAASGSNISTWVSSVRRTFRLFGSNSANLCRAATFCFVFSTGERLFPGNSFRQAMPVQSFSTSTVKNFNI